MFLLSHKGPNSWPGTCVTGSHQSPINIDRDDVIHVNSYMPLHFFGYDDRAEVLEYSHSDYRVNVKISRGSDLLNQPYVSNYN
jgi:carbonic anhydrase